MMVCIDCPKVLSAKNSSGYCATCCARRPEVRAKKGKLNPEQRAARSLAMHALNADRDVVARRAASMSALRDCPVYRAKHAAACAAAKARILADPQAAEKMREAGRRVGSANFWAVSTPEAREKARIAIRRKHLAWCPEEYWPLNASLKAKGYRLPERQTIILAEVPGTAEHARRVVANYQDAARIREERRRAQAY